ncbi:glycosyltransferase family 2 protein [Echinicola strongylocentroti]|uniref:Glycosyltransferase family 2 protein n=1 Tax=Echinicola strongylocentroti TaxID=1795355 RepID=A0A2Z4IP46_9BACT|nr:glycosyltransferase family A protein [Echinicola strongylocentroti]AWW32530.1 glycosyltransferase family 2 protein [Echinicola strongylocentroti]
MFSIVIPLYNKEENISKTLASVQEQSYTDYEIVIVNDGSTDNSVKKVEEVNDHRIKLYHKKNGGVSDARNFGIEKAKNPYIVFLDADDLWKPNYLEEMALIIQEYPEAGMYNCAHSVIYKGKAYDMDHDIKRGIIENYFKTCLTHVIAWTSATIVRKDVFDKVGGFPVGMISGEDVYTWAKIALQYPVAFHPDSLTIYIKQDETIVGRSNKKDNCKESWQDLFQEGNNDVNKYIAMKAILKGTRYAWGGYLSESRKIEKDFKYINDYSDVQHSWKKLYLLNRTPAFVKKMVLAYKQAVVKSNKSAS